MNASLTIKIYSPDPKNQKNRNRKNTTKAPADTQKSDPKIR